MLLAHPRDDSLFEAIVAHQVRLVDDRRRTLAAARRALRRCYPAADLYRQSEVLIGGVPTGVWFAYRDGHLSPALPVSNWWRQLPTAAMLLPSGQLFRTTDDFRRTLGLPPLAKGEEFIADRLAPEIRAEFMERVVSLPGAGEVGGTIELRLPWGERRSVEFHVDGPGRTARPEYRLKVRSLEDRDEAMVESAAGLAFRAASPEQRSTVLKRSRVRRPNAGDTVGLVRQGPWAIVVVAGVIRLLVRVDGGLEPTLAYAGPGDLLGSHVVPSGDAIAIDAQAVTSSVVLELVERDVVDLIEANPRFSGAVIHEAQVLLGAAALALAARSGKNLTQRLAREIALLSELYPTHALIPVSAQQLADGTGSIRESVARALGTFRRRGWVATTGHGLLVIDNEALLAAATE